MKPLRLCLLALLLLAALPAHAQLWAGYSYPCQASPVCDGVRVTWVQPTPLYEGLASESTDGFYIWAGILGSTHAVVGNCAGSQLIQGGSSASKQSDAQTFHTVWHEDFPCHNVATDSSLSVQPGDTMFTEILCITNCTSGAAGQVWQFTQKNITRSLQNQFTVTLNADPAETVYMEQAAFQVERWQTAVDSAAIQPGKFAPIKFINPQVHEGGVWNNVPLSVFKGQKVATQVITSPSTYAYYSVSSRVGTAGEVFYICYTAVITGSSALFEPCPASLYSGTAAAGLGP